MNAPVQVPSDNDDTIAGELFQLHILPPENDDQLPENIFPHTPSSCASKRTHVTSPDRSSFPQGMYILNDPTIPEDINVFMDVDPFQSPLQSPTWPGGGATPLSTSVPMSSTYHSPLGEDMAEEPPEPFQGEKIFQLYSKQEFPRAGHIFKKGEKTIFHTMKEAVPDGYPYFPYMNKEEWSLAEFLATSRLSKGSIDAFLKTTWVSLLF